MLWAELSGVRSRLRNSTPDFLHYLTLPYLLLPACILQYPKLPFAYCSGYASPHLSPRTAKHAHSCDSLPGLHYELLHSANIQMTVLGDVSQPAMRYLLDGLLLWHMARYRQVLLEFRRQWVGDTVDIDSYRAQPAPHSRAPCLHSATVA